MAAPLLTDLDAPTFAENAVNATPQLIDSDVTFADVDGDFDGGTLTVSGLLAEDRVSLLSGAAVSLVAGVVYYDADGVGGAAAVAIGVAVGGVGGTFTVTFNGAASTAMVEAVIENLTYANVSDTPTATRNLVIAVTDAVGDTTPGAAAYFEAFGAANPLNGVNIGQGPMPTAVDFDLDGDLDIFLGESAGRFRYLENVGDITTPVYEVRGGAANPFNGLDIGYSSAPVMVDLDGDGDLDIVSADFHGRIHYLNNFYGTFVERVDGDNPFDGMDFGTYAAIAMADFDGDGDLDVVVGVDEMGRELAYVENTGDAISPAFTVQTGVDNPFAGHTFTRRATPAAGDVDGDGDIDLVVGDEDGRLRYLENTGASYVERTGSANPFSGIDVGYLSRPTLADIDGDGDLDLIVAANAGPMQVFFNQTPPGVLVPVGVTAEPDSATPNPDTLTGTNGADTIDGLAGDDILDGGQGDDYLKGGAGADTMYGRTGNDTYVVDDVNDITDETGGNGTDLVWSRVDWTLGANIENLTLGAGGRDIDGTGNDQGNRITGNDFENVLTGLGGNDVLLGGGRNDILNGGADSDILDGGIGNDVLNGGDDGDDLTGGAGHDRLDGGAGGDDMIGGLGNDVYVIDDLLDTVLELAGGGFDTVESSLSWTLDANLEHLTLTGGADIDGAGNAVRNTLTGNSGANHLSGGGEVDTLSGAGGDDTLHGDAGVDILNGGADDDVLYGGAGSDKLTGGTGADRFIFTDIDLAAILVERDQILDLSFAEGDVVDLSGIDANASAAGDQAFVWAAKFTKVAGQAVLKFAGGVTTLELDVDGDGKSDFRVAITGNHLSATGNLYGGPGDTDGGWLL